MRGRIYKVIIRGLEFDENSKMKILTKKLDIQQTYHPLTHPTNQTSIQSINHPANLPPSYRPNHLLSQITIQLIYQPTNQNSNQLINQVTATQQSNQQTSQKTILTNQLLKKQRTKNSQNKEKKNCGNVTSALNMLFFFN